MCMEQECVYSICYVWRNGLIQFGDGDLPDGALLLENDITEEKLEKITANARHGYNDDMYVTGVPEAQSDEEALGALTKFLERVA